ncbi:MAG: hypothetical protein K2W82_10560 [Candidatus Obscuribacterales bacterium]|nr:hypothetical protein [Candidatus Obscuribacterales bacterium]
MSAVPNVINAEPWETRSASDSLPSVVAKNNSSRISIDSLPDWTPRISHRQAPILVKTNRILRALLIGCCGLAILGYGLDVASSADISKLQEQARRLSEQNTELSAQLLKSISFQGIQANVVGRAGLRVPERVLIVKEIKPAATKPYKARKHFLPIMSGY